MDGVADLRRAAATITATAEEARRLRSESARLVSMIGTRAKHNSRGVRFGQERQALGEHVAGFEVRNDEHVRVSGDRRYDLLDRSRLRADRIVERERPVEQRSRDLTTVRHLA